MNLSHPPGALDATAAFRRIDAEKRNDKYVILQISNAQNPKSKIQNPKFKIQNPKSKIQNSL